MRKQWTIVAVLVALLVAGGFLVLRLSPEIFPVEVGSAAPAFKAVRVATGDTVTLARYRGDVVVLNIWATWCEPCRVEMPSLERLEQALGPRGLKIVAVSVDVGSAQAVRDFQRQYGLTFDVLQDRSNAIARAYQTTGVPETFVLDRHGIIVKKVPLAYDWDSQSSQKLMARLLAQQN